MAGGAGPIPTPGAVRVVDTLSVERIRLYCRLFWVDVRVRRFGDVWIVSADTPDGPTLGTGVNRGDALYEALECFADVRSELIGTIEHLSAESA